MVQSHPIYYPLIVSLHCPCFFYEESFTCSSVFYILLGFGVIYSSVALVIGLETRSRLGFVSFPGANYLGLGRIAGVGFIVGLLYLMPRGGRSTIFSFIAVSVTGGALLLSGGRGPVVALAIALLLSTLT